MEDERYEENANENQYLKLLHNIITNGDVKGDRTGTGTVSLFGEKVSFDLTYGKIPIFTTKKVNWKAALAELLWMIRGDTDSKKLLKEGVNIWEANSSRKFLDERGLHEYREGDLGPVYGFQWVHYGAKYEGCDADYSGKGINQLEECVKEIRANPDSRRLVVCSWNPSDLEKMALPPCPITFQFNVAGEFLDCQVYQRSADMALGVPFNVAEYSFLTHMMARLCNLKPRTLHYAFGDAHVYNNHVEGVIKQLWVTFPPR